MQAAKTIKTSEFMPYVVFIAAPPVELQRNMYEYARLKGKMQKIRTVRVFVFYAKNTNILVIADDECQFKGY
jgi:hypothetical protein